MSVPIHISNPCVCFVRLTLARLSLRQHHRGNRMVTDTPLCQIQLIQGQTYRCHVTAGATLIINSGRIQLHEPHNWLAETMLSYGQILQEGQSHQLRQSGWICITATTAAELLYCPALPASSALWRQLRKIGLRLLRLIRPAQGVISSPAHD